MQQILDASHMHSMKIRWISMECFIILMFWIIICLASIDLLPREHVRDQVIIWIHNQQIIVYDVQPENFVLSILADWIF